jgi:hypothetical protein
MTSPGCCIDQTRPSHSGLACAGLTHTAAVSNRGNNISNEQHGGEPAVVETLLVAQVPKQPSAFCETRQFIALHQRPILDDILSLMTPILSLLTPILSLMTPILCLLTPILSLLTPILCLLTPILSLLTPFLNLLTPVLSLMTPILAQVAPFYSLSRIPRN